MSGNKSDRSMSPAAMSEESRRELIARQHRALYGNESSAFYPSGGLGDDSQPSGPSNTAATGPRGSSPRGVDPFGGLGQSHGQPSSDHPGLTPAGAPTQSNVAHQPRSRANSTSSPNSNANPASYVMFEPNPAQQQQSSSTPSPGGGVTDSPTSRQNSNTTSVGPIGTRPGPPTTQAPNPALNKRSTTPLPSPLSYGYASNEAVTSAGGNTNSNGIDKIASSTPNPAHTTSSGASGSGKKEPNNVSLGWGNGSGVWRSKGSLGVQASVWG